MGGPVLQQGAIHREVFIAEQRLDRGSANQLLHKPAYDVAIEKPIAFLGECDEMPDQIIRAQAHKPAEKQVVVELLQ